MKIIFLLGMLLLNQQPNFDNQINIRLDGSIVANIERKELLLDIPGGTFIHDKRLHTLIEKLDKEYFQEPKNATINDHGMIEPEQIGYKLNKELFTTQLVEILYNKDESMIDMKRLPVYPAVDSELLLQIKEKKIGEYVTYYNANNQKRSYNILLAAKAINNQVVFPGQTFSFNTVVGKRTKNKGYLPAPIIVRGELSEGIGGGICQVSSTLFNAVDHSGLKVTERYSHSKSVPYVPKGRDATVSWYGPDFKFVNKYTQPILIKAKTYEGVLIVTIYSSESINYKPRKVPNASNTLPEEISVSVEEEKEKSSD
jgi:vancomycin resistance protein YoaR